MLIWLIMGCNWISMAWFKHRFSKINMNWGQEGVITSNRKLCDAINYLCPTAKQSMLLKDAFYIQSAWRNIKHISTKIRVSLWTAYRENHILLLLSYSMLIFRHNNVCAERLSIHLLPWAKWQNKITDDNFKCYFPKLVSFDEKFIEVCSLGCDRWNVIGLDNFLTLNRRQAIIYSKQKK